MNIKKCSLCKEKRSAKFFYKNKSKHDGLCDRCKECHKEYQRKARHRVKEEGIAKYGGECICCKQSNPAFLTIDHINGRNVGDILTGGKLWMELKKQGWPKKNIQLMCFNCNCAKGIYGYCPHQLEKK